MERMRVGFTGTQIGMTSRQIDRLYRVMKAIRCVSYKQWDFHHGDCIGADEQAALMSKWQQAHVVGHPPKDGRKRAFFVSDESRDPDLYLDRNRAIVDETTILIATPKGMREELRSGVWATIRYAKQQKHPILIIWPNGKRERR